MQDAMASFISCISPSPFVLKALVGVGQPDNADLHDTD